jgi:hypothetical protein
MDPDQGGPKICGSCGYGSQTLNFHCCISKAKRKQTRGKRSNAQTFFSCMVFTIKHKIYMKKEENSILRSGGKVTQEGLI